MLMNVYDVKSKPVYDENTGKFLGWKVIYLADMDDQSLPLAYSRFFQNKWYRNSYRAACRFQNKLLLKQNENTK